MRSKAPTKGGGLRHLAGSLGFGNKNVQRRFQGARQRRERDLAVAAAATPADAAVRRKPVQSRATAPGEPGELLDEEDVPSQGGPATVGAIILGGGAGTRLQPLTSRRAKPAVPIGGAYRLIDVPMSNCLNSNINKIYILTQFNSTSLNRHMSKTYSQPGVLSKGFVEVLAASQSPGDKNWFQGTADAVRQYAWMLRDAKNRSMADILILSGDHLYRMDYMDFVNHHRQASADITIGCLPCSEEQAKSFGIMKLDDRGGIADFAEKPQGDRLQEMRTDPEMLKELFDQAPDPMDTDDEDGTPKLSPEKKPYLASMGIYVFKRSVLCNILAEKPDLLDFGGDLIPYAQRTGRRVIAYCFPGYWEDIGTIKTFFDANISLAAANPKFKFADPAQGLILTSPRHLPPAQIEECEVSQSIISFGAHVAKSTISNSIIGLRARVGEDCVLDEVMVMGADYFESDAELERMRGEGGVPIGIGAGSNIHKAILDKNARIGKNVTITDKEGHADKDDGDGATWMIKSGIVVVPKDATIPDNTVI